MTVLVSVDSLTGTLIRYESGGSNARETHAATAQGPMTFSRAVVEGFRTSPDERFATRTLADPPAPCDVA